MIIVLGAASGAGQSRTKQSGPKPVAGIRQIDFLNFNYHASLCSREYGRKGIGETVRVRNGEFKNRNAYFAVADKKIIYADVTGDGREEAIVPVDCGALGANFSLSEVNVYTIRDGRAALLAQISDKNLERDYRRNYPDAESYWGINDSGIKAGDGNVEIEVLVDGPHASPKYIVRLEYRLSGRILRLNGKPQRRPRPE